MRTPAVAQNGSPTNKSVTTAEADAPMRRNDLLLKSFCINMTMPTSQRIVDKKIAEQTISKRRFR